MPEMDHTCRMNGYEFPFISYRVIYFFISCDIGAQCIIPAGRAQVALPLHKRNCNKWGLDATDDGNWRYMVLARYNENCFVNFDSMSSQLCSSNHHKRAWGA